MSVEKDGSFDEIDPYGKKKPLPGQKTVLQQKGENDLANFALLRRNIEG